jgi:dienelactone hydrolase
MKQTSPELAFAGGDLKAWQRKVRRKVSRLTGYEKMPKKRCALKPRSIWKREHRYGTIEKIVFTSEPKADVTAYLCLPKKAKPPYSCMIAIQGHSSGVHHCIGVERDDETKAMKVEGDRDHGIRAMKEGVAALCIEQRSFGERREQKVAVANRTMCHEASVHALMLGRTLIGERVYDVDRGIDYLATRSDIDMKKLGVMGNSGGGTISVFSAALLSRLSIAVPSCYFCTFKASIMSLYHCTCNFVPGLYNVADMSDILGTFAPKPVVVVAGKDDHIFPIKATRKAFRDLQKIYDAAGVKKRAHLVVGQEGHRFYADQAWPKILKELMG